ncbi:hypothetical protein LptCag_2386 [Leptospirillum ferriphilum]|uniref:Uncharacterized protein n=1 Tax=Leptospirillum ferriphilum TaxID=178606 RepID=A0A094WH16_9BACT|nr:hypothetical protein LptCag_2386 [Leptospirillum ferriphilum]
MVHSYPVRNQSFQDCLRRNLRLCEWEKSLLSSIMITVSLFLKRLTKILSHRLLDGSHQPDTKKG